MELDFLIVVISVCVIAVATVLIAIMEGFRTICSLPVFLEGWIGMGLKLQRVVMISKRVVEENHQLGRQLEQLQNENQLLRMAQLRKQYQTFGFPHAGPEKKNDKIVLEKQEQEDLTKEN